MKGAQPHEIGATFFQGNVAAHDVDHVNARKQFLNKRLRDRHAAIVRVNWMLLMVATQGLWMSLNAIRMRCGWLLPALVAMGWALLVPPAQAAQSILRVLTWSGYADPDLVAVFEKRHGVRVEVTLVGSDDVLRAKLADTKAPAYDVVAANTVEIARFVELQQLAPLPLDAIPNAARQLPRFRQLDAVAGITLQGQVYALPYTYSEMGLIYDRQQLLEPPESLAVLWDPHWQGRVLAYDGSSHAFSLAALHLKQSPFRIDPAQWGAVSRDLVALRRNVLSLYTLPEESLDLFRRHGVAVMHANYGQQQLKLFQDAGLDVGYVVPREGALAWLDCWAIPSRSQQRSLAAKWIDYMLEPQVGRELTRRQGLANTLEEPQGLTGSAVKGPILWLEPVEDAAQRQRLWLRIVSGDRPERF